MLHREEALANIDGVPRALLHCHSACVRISRVNAKRGRNFVIHPKEHDLVCYIP